MPRTSVKIWQRSAPEAGREGDRGRVAAAAAERRDVGAGDVAALAGVRAALEAGHDHDLALVELASDAGRLDARDPGLAVAAVGRDAGLRAAQADRLDAERVEGHRDERRALVLAGREEHVELALVGRVGDRGGEAQELVGRVAHRGHDDDEVRAGRRSRAIRLATRRIRSASARLEPPNFCTTSGAGIGPFYPGPTHAPNVGESRDAAVFVARPGLLTPWAHRGTVTTAPVPEFRDAAGHRRRAIVPELPRRAVITGTSRDRSAVAGRAFARHSGVGWSATRALSVSVHAECADRATRSRCAARPTRIPGREEQDPARRLADRVSDPCEAVAAAGRKRGPERVRVAPDPVARRRALGDDQESRHAAARPAAISGDLRREPRLPIDAEHGVPGLADARLDLVDRDDVRIGWNANTSIEPRSP